MSPPSPGHDNMDLGELRTIAKTASRAELDQLQATPDAPTVPLDLYILLDAEIEAVRAHVALSVFATGLTDLFGASTVEAPTRYMSEVMVHARVLGPGGDDDIDELRAALAAVVHEVLGADAGEVVAVVRAGDEGPVTAVLRAEFADGTDPESFAQHFSTRDYFRWQLELGETHGIGAVRSEPSTVLGSDRLFPFMPPDLMISFVITGDVRSVVPEVVRDLERRLEGAPQPTELEVMVSVDLQDTTPAQVQDEIDRWAAMGCELFEPAGEALVRPMPSATLSFDFPVARGG